MLWVLHQPLTVEVVAVVGHQISWRGEVPPSQTVEDSSTFWRQKDSSLNSPSQQNKPKIPRDPESTSQEKNLNQQRRTNLSENVSGRDV